MAISLSNFKPPVGWGGAWLDSLAQALTGLAQDSLLGALKISVVDGAAAGTPITLTGATADDKFIGAVLVAGAGTDVTDVSGIDSATLGDDQITFEADTSGGKVIVFWVDVSALNVTA